MNKRVTTLEQSFDELKSTHERLVEAHEKLDKAHIKLGEAHSTLSNQVTLEVVDELKSTRNIGIECDIINESFFRPIVVA